MQSNQNKMKDVKKEIDKIKKQYKDNKSKQAEETMKLYKKAGINPASGCLPLLIQLPIFIALYRVFLNGLESDNLTLLYGFVSEPDVMQAMFLGIDLHTPSIVFGILAGALQFIQMKWLAPQQPATSGANEDAAAMTASMQKNMMYIFPVMMVFISMQIPAALSLYFVVTTLFGIGQQYALKRIMRLEGNAPTV
jgi:YidC/Oxa1 family membrane protein insertase